MESLGEETWDVVICGTGLSQSLLALALSRSNKRIIHLDKNDFYGEHDAALSLQEADAWAQAYAGGCAAQQLDQPLSSTNDTDEPVAGPSGAANVDNSATTATPSSKEGLNILRNAHVWKHSDAEAKGLSFPRAYSLALAPQIIHTKSELLSQLVASKAYRQVEFLAVRPSFFIYSTTDTNGASLARIPSSREDIFLARHIPARSKRKLMRFLKFVIDHNSDEQKPVWQEKANRPLSELLVEEFKLDDEDLRDSILALTLTLDEKVTVKDGLAMIHRHISSMGLFGRGFCAVYPKWGGLSEIAQVGCRAGAVGGGIYMLDTEASINEQGNGREVTLNLSNKASIRTAAFVSSQQTCSTESHTIARLVAIINSPLDSLFDHLADHPKPAVTVIVFSMDPPIYAFVHSSDTGECPEGQSVIYMTMRAVPQSYEALDGALECVLRVIETIPDGPEADVLYKLYYEQGTSAREPVIKSQGSATVFEFPSPSVGLAFDDTSLAAVKEAWKIVMNNEVSDDEFMKFEDREGMGDDDDISD
ncbi:rab protein geranylgeranyltransferase component A [Xylaria scruposa]|nr:rab protein geranylgeranyltransferase component A [Xylaria scruposa]